MKNITVSIDFGTSNCAASWINPNTGIPEVVRFKDSGSEKLPSVVHIADSGKITVGVTPYYNLEEASRMDGEERDEIINNTITSIKTKMMKGNVTLHHGKSYGDDEIISFILKKVKEQIEQSCSIPQGAIDKVVLTIPAEFKLWKKEMLKHAAILAGFKNVDFLEEPISAALYAIKRGVVPKTSKGVLVYDFGAGTFDVAYVQPQAGESPCLPIPPQGERCGGDDIDALLYNDWDKFLKDSKGKHISSDPEEIDLAFLYRCRREKEQLSRGNSADYVRQYIPGIGLVEKEISEAKFRTLTEPVIDKTIAKTKMLLDEIKAKKLPLDHVILIGGSSRLPLVQEKLQQLVGANVKVLSTGDMDIAVAVGAMYSVLTPIQAPKTGSDSKPKPTPAPKPAATKVTSHFCIYCGKPILSNQKFCMQCGKANYSYKS